MKILIVEDEIRIAKLLERMVREIWAGELTRLHRVVDVGEANNFLSKYQIDLLFLDLNLKGQNGFELLQKFITRPFHTVIVSAYKEQAIKAFEYGVLDFIPKPFNKERLRQTYLRLKGTKDFSKQGLQFISIKKSGKLLTLPIEEIVYIKAEGHYTEIYLPHGRKELSDHSMEKLLLLLPQNFMRIHRSYVVNLDLTQKINKYPGSKYELELNGGVILPIGRSRLKALESRMI